jgi:hypothetical protein
MVIRVFLSIPWLVGSEIYLQYKYITLLHVSEYIPFLIAFTASCELNLVIFFAGVWSTESNSTLWKQDTVLRNMDNVMGFM